MARPASRECFSLSIHPSRSPSFSAANAGAQEALPCQLSAPPTSPTGYAATTPPYTPHRSRASSASDRRRKPDGDANDVRSAQDESESFTDEWQPYSGDRYVRATITRAEVEAALEGGDYVIIEEEVMEELCVEEPGEKPNVVRRIRRKVLKNKRPSTMNTTSYASWDTDSITSVDSRPTDSTFGKGALEGERPSFRMKGEDATCANIHLSDFMNKQRVGGGQDGQERRGFQEKSQALGQPEKSEFSEYLETQGSWGKKSEQDDFANSGTGSGKINTSMNHIGTVSTDGNPNNKGDKDSSTGNWNTLGNWSGSKNISSHESMSEMQKQGSRDPSSSKSDHTESCVGAGHCFRGEGYDRAGGLVGNPGGFSTGSRSNKFLANSPGGAGLGISEREGLGSGPDDGCAVAALVRVAQPPAKPPAPPSEADDGEGGFECWERPQRLLEQERPLLAQERPLLPSPPPSPTSGSTESSYRRRFYDPYQLDRHAVWYGDKYKWMTGVPLPAWVMELRMSDESAFTECMEHFQAFGRWPSDAELGPCPTAIPAAGGGFMHNPAAPLPTYIKLTRDRSTLNQYFTHFKIFGRWPRIA